MLTQKQLLKISKRLGGLYALFEDQVDVNKLLIKRLEEVEKSYKMLFRIVDGLREEINKLKKN